MPLTKCQRADIKPKVEDKDYMHGIAALAGVGVATVYWMIAVLRYLGIVQHNGYCVTTNRRAHPIRISKLCIALAVREWLFRITGAADVWCERHVKKSEKAAERKERKYFVAEKASAAGSAMPERLANYIRSTRTQTREIIHYAKNRNQQVIDYKRQCPDLALARISHR